MKKTTELFTHWNSKKILLENTETKHIVKKRQFWLFNVGINVGNEESKSFPFIRPGLIINNYMKGDLILIVPLTSKYNENLQGIYYKIDGIKYGLDKDSYILLNQFKVISKKRLIRKLNDTKDITLLENNEFLKILNLIKNFI